MGTLLLLKGTIYYVLTGLNRTVKSTNKPEQRCILEINMQFNITQAAVADNVIDVIENTAAYRPKRAHKIIRQSHGERKVSHYVSR